MKLNDSNETYVDNEISKAICIAGKLLSSKVNEENSKLAWESMKQMIKKYYGYTELSEVVCAIENGSIGRYGDFKTINGKTVIGWIKDRQKEINEYKPSKEAQVQQQETEIREIAGSEYPRAVLLRQAFNPGGIYNEFNDIDFIEIVQGIRQGLNVFTGEEIKETDYTPNKNNKLNNNIVNSNRR